MTAAEFKKKWSRYTGKESSAYQEHFNDLCRLLGQPSPAEADPSGADFFCFQKRVVKDAELFAFPRPTPEQEAAVAAAANELNELRERWLNPPEWTVEKILEFPGSVNGPWGQYVTDAGKDGIGTVR